MFTLETVKERDRDLEDFGSLGVTEDDYLDPEDASKIVAHQLETRMRVKHCRDEIEGSFVEASARSREEDLVGWLAEELRREYLSGYAEGLEELDLVLENLADGTPVKAHPVLADKEHYRRRAVDRIARINEGLLRRQEQKDKRGTEN